MKKTVSSKNIKAKTARALKVDEKDITVKNTAYSFSLARINAESRPFFRILFAAALAGLVYARYAGSSELKSELSSAKQEVTQHQSNPAKPSKIIKPLLADKCDFS